MTPCDDDDYQCVSVETLESPHNSFTYLAAVCICAIIPPLKEDTRANMHLTFGIEDDNSIRRKFDETIKKRNTFHNTHFDAARCNKFCL